MRIELDRSLLGFQLKTLLSDKLSLLQLAFWHWWLGGMAFGRKGIAAGAALDGMFWTNYALLAGACVLCVMGSVCVVFTVVKPKRYGMFELLLASPLSLRRFAGTSLAACAAFCSVNLALHFALVKARFGFAPHGAGFWGALAAALAFSLLVLLLTVFLALRRKDAEQLHALLIAVGFALIAVMMITKFALLIPVWLPPAITAASLALGGALWAGFDKMFTKEKVLA